MSESIGGFDIRFNIDEFIIGSSIELITNVCIVDVSPENKLGAVYPVGTTFPTSSLILTRINEHLIGVFYGIDKYNILEGCDHYLFDISSVRILFHDEFCTIYIDNSWVYTFSFDYILYPTTLDLTMNYFDGTTTPTGTCTITNVVIQELSDWREAIYIDLDTNTMNAIGSIIQQRPVNIVSKYDGSLQFYYEQISPQNVNITNIKNYIVSNMNSQMSCSDAIVYYSDVNVLSDISTAKKVGLVTKIYRMSEIDHGALKAASVLQKKSRQNCTRHKLQGRFNMNVEVGDIAVINYLEADTGVEISTSFIVEIIQMTIQKGESFMTLEGRSND